MRVAAISRQQSESVSEFGLERFGSDLYEEIGTDDVLTENNKRFVLFPINYRNVST